MSYIDELERIQKLKEKNILTQEEFEIEKKKILNENQENNINQSSKKIKDGDKGFIYKYKYLIIGITLILIFILVIGMNNGLGKIKIPDIVGLTVEEAQREIEDKNLRFFIEKEEYNTEVAEGYIISQTPKANSKTKKGTKIGVVVSKGEEPEDVKQKRLEQEELQSRVPNTIKKYAETVRAQNNGTVKYDSYTIYKTATSGETVYKVKYSTSSSNNTYSRIYYYQLLSLDNENKEVVKSTKLYLFHETTTGSEINEYGDDYAMEYEYEQLWGV